MNKRTITILLCVLLLVFIFYILFVEQEEEMLVLPPHPGFPVGPTISKIIDHNYFALCYNEDHEQADWVMYHLTAAHISGEIYKRTDNFRSDPAIVTGSSSPRDYRGSGYDRGHLVPAADQAWSPEAMSSTFFMSNMSPQSPQFNRGIWKKLETRIREWAKQNDELFIITGPVLTDIIETIGDNEVSVPKYYYKVVLDYKEPDIKGIAFVMENVKASADIWKYSVSIDSVEHLTGLDFFSSLPDEFETKIESSLHLEDWR